MDSFGFSSEYFDSNSADFSFDFGFSLWFNLLGKELDLNEKEVNYNYYCGCYCQFFIFLIMVANAKSQRHRGFLLYRLSSLYQPNFEVHLFYLKFGSFFSKVLDYANFYFDLKWVLQVTNSM